MVIERSSQVWQRTTKWSKNCCARYTNSHLGHLLDQTGDFFHCPLLGPPQREWKAVQMGLIPLEKEQYVGRLRETHVLGTSPRSISFTFSDIIRAILFRLSRNSPTGGNDPEHNEFHPQSCSVVLVSVTVAVAIENVGS